MPLYSISTGVPTMVTTNTALTLGFAGGMTAPPDLLLWNCSTGGTVTLPAILPVLPSPPGTPGTSPGIGDGYTIKFINLTGNSLTILPASGTSDTVNGGASVLLPNLNQAYPLQASEIQDNWYNTGGSGAGTIREVAGAATIATTDRYLIDSVASAITLPAPSNFPVGVPFVTVSNSSSGSLTITPASGTIQGEAAYTLTTLNVITIFTDSTNFYRSA